MMTGMRVTIVLAAICGASAVNPMDKVITLLKDLGAKVDAQGRKEAIQYEKFSCFCKHQATKKRAAIADSVERLKVLQAQIDQLKPEIKELGGEVSKLNKGITSLEGDVPKKVEGKIKEEKGERKVGHNAYLGAFKDLSQAIAGCELAIESLKASKDDMKGDGVDLNLVQMKSVKTALSAAGVLQQNPANFKYSGNAIIATIQDILTNLKKKKAALDLEEIGAKDASSKKVLSMVNSDSFKVKERHSKELSIEDRESLKAAAQSKYDKENKAKTADEKFLKTLVADCEAKAESWDQRSTARADEIAALAEATTFLEQGAAAAYNANSKIASLMKVSSVAPKKLSFLQIAKGAAAQAEASKKVLSILDNAALETGSRALSALAFKVSLKIDHFSNVRKLIGDLVAKLEADAKAEATTKGFCDKEMKAATGSRDDAQAKIEEHQGDIAKSTATAEDEAAGLEKTSKALVESAKDKNEMIKMRNEEKADNAAALAEAKKGHDAVKTALGVLKGFYEKKSASEFLQAQQAPYVPPNAGRDGKSVKDLAPDAFASEDYNGSQAESKGVIGILEVIEKDFDRTVANIEKEEKAAGAAYKIKLENLDDEMEDLADERDDHKDDKEEAEGELVEAKNNLKDQQALHAGAKEQLNKLSSMCVDDGETHAERVAKREKEMQSLKDATALLDELMGAQ